MGKQYIEVSIEHPDPYDYDDVKIGVPKLVNPEQIALDNVSYLCGYNIAVVQSKRNSDFIVDLLENFGYVHKDTLVKLVGDSKPLPEFHVCSSYGSSFKINSLDFKDIHLRDLASGQSYIVQTIDVESVLSPVLLKKFKKFKKEFQDEQLKKEATKKKREESKKQKKIADAKKLLGVK